jgi:dTDP-glucose 4,6-dehydratase
MDLVIHAATDASAALLASHPLAMLDTVVQGTRAALRLAEDIGARRLLLTSSGAVYGRQPAALTHMPETFLGAPDPSLPGSAYAEGKRVAETMCACATAEGGLETVVARCFAFVGPYLPLDTHFAIGNFIRDSLRGEPIRIAGDGTPHRSYLYAADLAAWLWTILLRGAPGRPYNVGSARSLSIAALAEEVRTALGSPHPVEVAGTPVPGAEPHRYVPDVSRAERELGLREHVALGDAIRRTAEWHARATGLPTG